MLWQNKFKDEVESIKKEIEKWENDITELENELFLKKLIQVPSQMFEGDRISETFLKNMQENINKEKSKLKRHKEKCKSYLEEQAAFLESEGDCVCR